MRPSKIKKYGHNRSPENESDSRQGNTPFSASAEFASSKQRQKISGYADGNHSNRTTHTANGEKKRPVEWYTVSENQHGQRLDNFLLTHLKAPKALIYKIIRKGEVRVNKGRVKPLYKLQENDQIRIPPVVLDQSTTVISSPERYHYLEALILFEDDTLLALNKPSGLAVHGGSGISTGLIEQLRQIRPNAKFLELVHRLDRDTSGVILVAKKRNVLLGLHQQLIKRQMNKQYHAVVAGEWPVSIRMVKDSLHKFTLSTGERMVKVDETNGKVSETRYRLLGYNPNIDCSLVEAQPLTGRTHQIRVHCQAAGHPIANDEKYGIQSFSRTISALGTKRLCLHAAQLTFTHPQLEQKMTLHAAYDSALTALVKHLELG